MERRFLLEEDFQKLMKRYQDFQMTSDELRDFIDSEIAARMKMVADYQQWLAKQES